MQRCKGHSIAVIGDGKLGLLVAQVLVQQSGGAQALALTRPCSFMPWAAPQTNIAHQQSRALNGREQLRPGTSTHQHNRPLCAGRQVVHFGRHKHKLQPIKGTQRVVVDAEDKAFDHHEHVRSLNLKATLPGSC